MFRASAYRRRRSARGIVLVSRRSRRRCADVTRRVDGDIMNGGPGNDRLRGGPGFDQMNGDDGDDVLMGAVRMTYLL
jgi:RTX calcium-binding nonapeptide repeat (4 copies)